MLIEYLWDIQSQRHLLKEGISILIREQLRICSGLRYMCIVDVIGFVAYLKNMGSSRWFFG